MAKGSTAAMADNPGVIAPPPLIALGTFVLGLLLDWLTGTFAVQFLLALQTRILLGLELIIGGVALAIVARQKFLALGTNVRPWKPSLKLVTDGIFAWMRNPMYVGLALLTLGLGILFASDWTIILLVPAALLMHYGVVLREERYLEAKFGDQYRDYKAGVPRYGWSLR